MTGAIFTLTFFFVVGALAWRRITKARALRALERDVGAQREVVRTVSDYAALDAAVQSARCRACDGRFALISEGPQDSLVVVDLQCRRCGARTQLRFRVPEA